MTHLETALNLLEEYLEDRASMLNALNRAALLLRRFEICGGAAASDILLHELLDNNLGEKGEEEEELIASASTSVRNRQQSTQSQPTTSLRHPFTTRNQQIQALRSAYTLVLTEHIVPLAHLQQKLTSDLNEI